MCRGLTSLATGEVDSIEDVANMLGLDEDTCEGLALYPAMTQSFKDLSKAYKIREHIIKALYGLSRGKMDLVRPLGQEYGEFHTEKSENLFKLIMRLAPIMHVREEEGDSDETVQASIAEEEISPMHFSREWIKLAQVISP